MWLDSNCGGGLIVHVSDCVVLGGVGWGWSSSVAVVLGGGGVGPVM